MKHRKKLAELTSAVNTLTEETIEVQDRAKTVVDTAETASNNAENSASSAKNLRDSTQQLRNETVSLRDQAKASADRAEQISELDKVADAIRLAAVPAPDFHLPLISDLQIREGFGPADQVDVSAAQDGSVMVDLPTTSAKMSRSSGAYEASKSGYLIRREAGEALIEEDGLLMEGTSTNFISSNNFIGFKGGVTFTANTTHSPTKEMNAGELIETNSDSDHFYERINNQTFEIGDYVSASIYIKHKAGFDQDGRSVRLWIRAYDLDGISGERSIVIKVKSFGRMELDTIDTEDSEVFEKVRGGLDTIGFGWYRVWIAGKLRVSSSDIRHRLFFVNSGTIYTGDGASGFYIFHEQFEPTPVRTSPITVDDSPVTRLPSTLVFEAEGNLAMEPYTIAFYLNARWAAPDLGNLDIIDLSVSGYKYNLFRLSKDEQSLQKYISGTSQTVSVQQGEKTLIVVTWDGTRSNIYVNGELQDSSTRAYSNPEGGLGIPHFISRSFASYHVSDFRVWKSVFYP